MRVPRARVASTRLCRRTYLYRILSTLSRTTPIDLLLMADDTQPVPAPPGRKEKAVWTDNDITLLLATIKDHKPAGGDGGNFSDSIWKRIALPVDAARTSGGVKSGSSCRNKWQSVSHIIFEVKVCVSIWASASRDLGNCREAACGFWLLLDCGEWRKHHCS